MTDKFVLAPGGGLIERFLGTDPLPRPAHAGLIWDRYLRVWEGSPEAPQRADLLGPLQEFVDAFNSRGEGARNPARDLLRQHRERLLRALEDSAPRRGRVLERPAFRVTWRLVTGLGAEHPTNNGFGFDPLIGVPYLPGSAVKGVCRRAAELDGMWHGEVDRLFGPDTVGDDATGGQGALSFFDAYPRRWPRLAVDVVNCHHPQYYHAQEQGQTAGLFPRETENPIPVFFLVVESGTEFVFPILALDQPDVDTAVGLLRTGLDLLGIGAKTAVGYGYMEAVEKKGAGGAQA